MTIKYTTAKDTKALEALQDKAIKSVKSARVHIQVALVATILHMGQHGDWTVASRLVEGLGNTVNGAAIVEWFKLYGNMSVNDKGFTGFTEKDFHKAILATLDDAKAKMWWELKPQNVFKGYSAETALQNFITMYKSQAAKLMTRPPEERAKVVLAVNEATIKQVMALCHFDAIIADAGNTDKVADEIKALETLTV